MDQEPIVRQFVRMEARFLGYLLAITRDPDAAEEILQDCAVVIMESAREDDIRDFAAWSKEVVRRQALRHLAERRRASSRIRFVESGLLDEISRSFIEDATAAEIARREQIALRDCVDRMPGRARKMIALRYEKRGSFERIAEAIGSTAAAVQRALSRARKSLHDCVRLKLKVVPE